MQSSAPQYENCDQRWVSLAEKLRIIENTQKTFMMHQSGNGGSIEEAQKVSDLQKSYYSQLFKEHFGG
jgi:hypothetical protein